MEIKHYTNTNTDLYYIFVCALSIRTTVDLPIIKIFCTERDEFVSVLGTVYIRQRNN